MNYLRPYPKWKACVVLLLAGAVIFYFGITNLRRNRQTLRWPVTEGLIRSANLKMSPWRRFYYADIVYDYQVAHVAYTNSRITFGNFWSVNRNHDHALSVLQRYAQGTKVTVFYDPNDPQNAVLETGVTDQTWTPLIFGGLFILWGTLPIVWFSQTRKNGGQQPQSSQRGGGY